MPSIWLVATSTNAQELINSVTQNLTQYEQIYAGKFATGGSTFETDLKSSLVSNLRGTLRIANYIWLNTSPSWGCIIHAVSRCLEAGQVFEVTPSPAVEKYLLIAIHTIRYVLR